MLANSLGCIYDFIEAGGLGMKVFAIYDILLISQMSMSSILEVLESESLKGFAYIMLWILSLTAWLGSDFLTISSPAEAKVSHIRALYSGQAKIRSSVFSVSPQSLQF
jgi:hypothetical protein